jgi:hypothetical protein
LNLWPTIMTNFYDNLSKAYDKHSYSPKLIWNCDEIGLQARRNYCMMVISKRGYRDVTKVLHKIKYWVTILCCVRSIEGK